MAAKEQRTETIQRRRGREPDTAPKVMPPRSTSFSWAFPLSSMIFQQCHQVIISSAGESTAEAGALMIQLLSKALLLNT